MHPVAAVLILSTAQSAAADTPPLELDLRCTGIGEVLTAQRSRATIHDADGDSKPIGVTAYSSVLAPKSLKLELRGRGGTLTYEDGDKREVTLSDVSRAHISGVYRRLLWTWQIRLDRLTGNLLVTNGDTITFRGECARAEANAEPKF